MRHLPLLFAVFAAACGATDEVGDDPWTDGKGDGFGDERAIDVVMTAPFCDVCTADDKAVLSARSPVTQKLVSLIDGATESIDIANYTFSVRTIEDALLRANSRGVTVRLAMDKGQEMGDTAATRLRAGGIDVKFVAGSGEPAGLQHAKFMLVDGLTLATGSNNWSSTGTSINEESTIVISSVEADPILSGFSCHFKAIWDANPGAAGACSNAEVKFSPSSAPIAMIKEEIGRAQKSIDVLMHHLVFDDLVKELAKAAERGVRVRVIINA
ncbi:MAG TPA: phospholipase D-like domain-containing protein, partial [Kofleriaceae bacterium]|nr:phospholipase D-like domain-containing protein [Kofleriaceae bacterium]